MPPRRNGVAVARPIAAAAAAYIVYKVETLGLKTSNVPVFYYWAWYQVYKYELVQKICSTYIRMFGTPGWLRTFFMNRENFIEQIKDRVSHIKLRAVSGDGRVGYFDSVYASCACEVVSKPEGSAKDWVTRIHNILGLQEGATYEDFNRAYKRKIAELQGGSLPDELRQIDYICRTPFGWDNYCAYRRGGEAVKRLPSMPDELLWHLSMRLIELKNGFQYPRKGCLMRQHSMSYGPHML
jgi:hypothetical protein